MDGAFLRSPGETADRILSCRKTPGVVSWLLAWELLGDLHLDGEWVDAESIDCMAENVEIGLAENGLVHIDDNSKLCQENGQGSEVSEMFVGRFACHKVSSMWA